MRTQPSIQPERTDGEPEIQVLGRVTAAVGDRSVELGGRRQELLLAVLAAAGGDLIPTKELVYRVWDDPDTPIARLHEGIKGLRDSFERCTGRGWELLPRGDGHGYRAVLAPHQVDLGRFQNSCRRARRLLDEQDGAAAVDVFREALGEWGDPDGRQPREPLAGLQGRWVLGYRQSLLEECRAAQRAYWQAQLRLGQHDQLIPALSQQVQAYPADENLVAMLMVAYYRIGRQPEATMLYRDTRHRLDQEGIRPSGELERIHQLVLQQDAGLDPFPQPLILTAGEPAAAPGLPPVTSDQGPALTDQAPSRPDRAASKPRKSKKRRDVHGAITIGGHGAVINGGSVQDLHVGDTWQLGHGGPMSNGSGAQSGRPE